MTSRGGATRPMARLVIRAFVLLALACCALAARSERAAAQVADPASMQAQYFAAAENGISAAGHWWDRGQGWYDEVYGMTGPTHLASIWGAVPLFESLADVALVQPTPANIAALERFAAGAERYWLPSLGTHGGFASSLGQHGRPRAWFDDNGWWGLAFLDAYRVTRVRRYLVDAQRALNFIVNNGWDKKHGGVWWDTWHSYKAGESLASATWLSAQLYRVTGKTVYRNTAEALAGWGRTGLWDATDGLFGRTADDPTPLPYVQGPMVAAADALCQAGAGENACDSVPTLLASAQARFKTLWMGPQYDAVYLRSLLYVYADTGDLGLYAQAAQYAAQAQANAGDGEGLWVYAWDGSPMTAHQSQDGMLRTHAATVSLFAALAQAPTPSEPPIAPAAATAASPAKIGTFRPAPLSSAPPPGSIPVG
jgi:Glycosyl hydrolase family 76